LSFEVTRREWLYASGSSLILSAAARASEPRNLSYPLATLSNSITPPERFFIRDHFPPPEIPLSKWRLRVEGHVDNPYELSYSDLVELPSRKLEAVIECAGNVANGSAVSNGVWEGVSMAALLERARPQAEAAFVLLEGADTGRIFESSARALPYTQRVPLTKCQAATSLVACKLNDRALPQANGFPARALLPGWYGMDSVKWLQRIVVLKRDDQASAFEESGLNRLYNRENASGEVVRLTSIGVKSVIAWPSNTFKLAAARYAVSGFAWSGQERIRSVRVSKNGGRDWEPVKLEPQTSPFAWVRWSYSWNASPGDYTLMSRATDVAGREQPLERDRGRKDAYELNWCAPVSGSVR
jgi:DMSO/TMAO reductase YedYZ molybdopterin-dependent catalytic subunit